MKLARIHRRSRDREQGYVLLMMLFFAALLIIAMTAAAPYLTTQIKRDRENEMIHRGEQYERAVKRYYRKFGRYPGRIEDLEKTNNIRFLRKRYKDPMNPTGAWRLVRYGEVQFGGAQGIAGATPVAAMGTGQQPNQGIFGSSGSSSGNSGSGSNTSDNPASGTTAQSTSLIGQQVVGGGGAIIGVASLSKKSGLHEFNKKAAYKDWFFVYDPTKDKGQLLVGPYNPNAFIGQYNNGIGGGGGAVGQPMGGNGGGFGQPGSGFGQQGSGFGQPSGLGQPQQPQGPGMSPQPPPK